MRTTSALQYPLDELVAAKGGTRVSVCLPARDEASTVGQIVTVIVEQLTGSPGLVDEVLVIDDGSSDGTAERASAAGARVVSAADVLVGCGPATGKGEALWKSVAACRSDVVVWCDADIRDFDHRFITGLVGPLLTDPALGFVKGCYRRDLDGQAGEGGRVTELVARPLLRLLFPHLAGFAQPLAGECAGRRAVLEQVAFSAGYGVDLGLLIDVADRIGVAAMAQVDLGLRTHRNRSLGELALQADEVLAVALTRAGVPLSAGQPAYRGADRPPLVEVAAYRSRPRR
ncbi:MAG: glucosyl-3-phosphoglycerate synthase [Acidimicrobiales bacterium]